MRVYMLFFLLLLANFPSNAQHCAFDYHYLFAVNVHAKNSAAKIPNLRMYLTDEKGKAITAQVIYQENHQWKHRMDTLYFWDNKSCSNKKGNSPLFRQKFFHVGDAYVVVVRLDIAKMKDPRNLPIFKLKIEATDDEETGNPIPEQTFFLPLNRALRICNSGIEDNFRLAKPLVNLEGNLFTPIDIVIDEVLPALAVDERYAQNPKYAIRFDFEKYTNAVAYNREEFKIRAADIYDVSSGKLHQRIEIPSQAVGETETSQYLSAIGDFYHRGIEEAKDFSVLMKTWRDTVFNVQRKQTNFYIFNTSTRQYELDSVLSKETDVYDYPPLNAMRRLEYLLTDKSKIINTWQWENKKWKLIDKREEMLPAFQPKIKYQPAAFITSNDKYHRLPVKAVFGTNHAIIVKDSFLIYNAFDDPVNITNVKSPFRDFFKIDQTLLPRQYTKLYFEGKIHNSSFDFQINDFNCYLILEDKTTLSFTVQVPVLSNICKLFYRPDSSIDYAIAQREKARFASIYMTDTEGNIRAKGTVLDGDTSLKQGKWQYFANGDWKIKDSIYTKAISVSVLNGTSYYDRPDYKLKCLEKGVWKPLLAQEENEQKLFYMTASMDSIVAYNDSLSYGFHLPYDQIHDNIQMQFYLLKPGQKTLKIGYYQTPFMLTKDAYAIIPDYFQVKDKNKTTYQITDSIILQLQKKYPALAPLVISKNMRAISIERLEAGEKKQFLAMLEADPGISFICQLFSMTDKQISTYCNNRIYVELNGYHPEPLRKYALELGFTDLQPDMGGNRYFLTYKSKMIDEQFFRAYQKLTESNLVLSAWFNSYFEPELDNRMPRGD